MGNRIENKLQWVAKLDCFPAPVSLYHRHKASSKSCFGGFFTGLTFALLATIFYFCFSRLFESKLKVKKTIDMQVNPSKVEINLTSFYFLAGVLNLENRKINPTQLSYEFIKTTIRNGNQAKRIVQMEKCRLQYFLELYPELEIPFNKMNFSQHLCLPNNETVTISGSRYSSEFQYFTFRVKGCGKHCPNTSFFHELYYQKKSRMTVNFYFINKYIQYNLDNPLEHYIEDRLFEYFQPQYSKHKFIYLTEYEIETRNSYLAAILHEQRSKQKGIFYNGKLTKQLFSLKRVYPNNTSLDQVFMEFNVFKDPQKLYVFRSHLQIDSVLSYMGGVVGIVLLIFGSMVRCFNTFLFKLRLSKNIFKFDNEQVLANEGIVIVKQQKKSMLKVFFIHTFLTMFDKIHPSNSCSKEDSEHCKMTQIHHKLNLQSLLHRLLSFEQNLKIALSYQKSCLLLLQKKLSFKISEKKYKESLKHEKEKALIEIQNFQDEIIQCEQTSSEVEMVANMKENRKLQCNQKMQYIKYQRQNEIGVKKWKKILNPIKNEINIQILYTGYQNSTYKT